jgi:hypothetical protein
LLALGLGVLAWSLLVDLPVTDETGALGNSFEGARGQAGTGLTLEIAAGLLAVLAGGLGLRRPRPPRPRRG